MPGKLPGQVKNLSIRPLAKSRWLDHFARMFVQRGNHQCGFILVMESLRWWRRGAGTQKDRQCHKSAPGGKFAHKSLVGVVGHYFMRQGLTILLSLAVDDKAVGMPHEFSNISGQKGSSS